MINTVMFDMGGTLEELESNQKTVENVLFRIYEKLAEKGVSIQNTEEQFWNKILDGRAKYKAYSKERKRELKPEQIWTDWILKDFHIETNIIYEIAEELAHMWEVTYFERKLRKGAKEMLSCLKQEGYKLSIISNTASLYQVFNSLENYGIRDYFEDVTLSSITGYRKPHPEIYKIAMHQMKSKPEECVFVGDRISKDILGAKNAKLAASIQLVPKESYEEDELLKDTVRSDYEITDIFEVVQIMKNINERG